MFKYCFFLGVSSSVLSSIGAVSYAYFYNDNLFDYSKILNYTSIAAACTFVCIFACVAFWAASMVLKSRAEFIFNLLFAFGSMGSIFYPINSNIPEDSFGYFAVYAIPLHFFPVLAWFVLKPLFFRAKLKEA